MRTNTELGDALDGGMTDSFAEVDKALRDSEEANDLANEPDEHADPLAGLAWSTTGADLSTTVTRKRNAAAAAE